MCWQPYLSRPQQDSIDTVRTKMISNAAFRSMQNVMWGLCFFKFVPYNWDLLNCHLTPIVKWWHRLLYNIHRFTTYGLAAFAMVRFCQALSIQKSKGIILTPRVAAMNILWGLAYGISGICHQQFVTKGDSIRYFGNSLFDYILSTKRTPPTTRQVYIFEDKTSFQQGKKGFVPGKLEGNRDGKKKGGRNFFSKIVILSGLMLVINPPFHSIMMIG